MDRKVLLLGAHTKRPTVQAFSDKNRQQEKLPHEKGVRSSLLLPSTTEVKRWTEIAVCRVNLIFLIALNHNLCLMPKCHQQFHPISFRGSEPQCLLVFPKSYSLESHASSQRIHSVASSSTAKSTNFAPSCSNTHPEKWRPSARHRLPYHTRSRGEAHAGPHKQPADAHEAPRVAV
jgi:hypothetical protein